MAGSPPSDSEEILPTRAQRQRRQSARAIAASESAPTPRHAPAKKRTAQPIEVSALWDWSPLHVTVSIPLQDSEVLQTSKTVYELGRASDANAAYSPVGDSLGDYTLSDEGMSVLARTT